MQKKIDLLKDIINDSDNIVFFGGAGVSTESGIPDFRSVDGLYNQTYKYPPEVILSHAFFINNTDDFYAFYKSKMIFREVKPNKVHLALAELEKSGKLKAVITQNIDGLHQVAGSKNVLELHGSIYRNYCMKCEKFYGIDIVIKNDIPICSCGGIIKPDVVLYEEPLDDDIVALSIKYISQAEVLIVGGTSLSVYPAAGFINYYSGDKLVLINKSATFFDNKADLLMHDSIGDVFWKLEQNTYFNHHINRD
jgi:NAD-dependent deacetylase